MVRVLVKNYGKYKIKPTANGSNSLSRLVKHTALKKFLAFFIVVCLKKLPMQFVIIIIVG